MSKTLKLLLVASTIAFVGCTNDERVALGGIAGAAGGMLATDTGNRYYNSYPYRYVPRYPTHVGGVVRGPTYSNVYYPPR